MIKVYAGYSHVPALVTKNPLEALNAIRTLNQDYKTDVHFVIINGEFFFGKKKMPTVTQKLYNMEVTQ